MNVSLAGSDTTRSNGYTSYRKQIICSLSQFFNNAKLYKSEGLAYYETITKAHAFPRPVVLDASPGYIASKDAVTRIQLAYAGHRLKVIVMLRDPIDRFISQYRFRRLDYFARNPTANRTLVDPSVLSRYFEGAGDVNVLANTLVDQYEAWEAANPAMTMQDTWEHASNYSGFGVEDPLWRSMYDQQLDMWFAAFPRSYFCILSMEYLRSDPAIALRRVATFLGLSSFDWASVGQLHAHTSSNSSDASELSAATRSRMESFFDRHGVLYWQHVASNGFHGCLPHRTAIDD